MLARKELLTLLLILGLVIGGLFVLSVSFAFPLDVSACHGQGHGASCCGNTFCESPYEDFNNCPADCPPPPICNNGVVEPGEQCDQGALNGACPAFCSSSCTINNCQPPQQCGNGILEPGEQCDQGGANGNCPAQCSSGCFVNNCQPPQQCGNGILEPGEQCDQGGANGNCPAQCSSGCNINSCQPPIPASCGGDDLNQIWPIVPDCPKYEWPELVLVAQRLMNFLIVLSIPLAAVGFAIAGFFYVTAAGSEERLKKAHSIFWKIGIGFLLVLTAWLIVYTITQWLEPGFRLIF